MRNLVLLIYSCFVFSQIIPFDVGETLTYDAFISGITAGRGELKVCGLCIHYPTEYDAYYSSKSKSKKSGSRKPEWYAPTKR